MGCAISSRHGLCCREFNASWSATVGMVVIPVVSVLFQTPSTISPLLLLFSSSVIVIVCSWLMVAVGCGWAD